MARSACIPSLLAPGIAILAALASACAPAAPEVPPIAALMEEGRLAEATAALHGHEPTATDDAEQALAAGRLYLMRNALDDAEEWLGRARELSRSPSAEPSGTATAAAELLAEAYRRQDRFADAAPVLRDAGREVEARLLESFGDAAPYRLDGPARTEIAFRQTDPLPVLTLAVNGREALFLLDTGGGELILDPDFAAAVGAEIVGRGEGTFAGGRKAETGRGRVASVRLGEITVHDVPVATLPTRRFGAVCGGCPVDGVLGTVLLYHFLPTIDYPGGRLVLRRRGTADGGDPGQHAVRFWLAGDHLVLAAGKVGDAGPLLLLVDTGLAGAAFTAPRSTLERAGLELPESGAGTGVGGGGAVSIVPFTVDTLSLGTARRQDLPALYGPFPTELEHALSVPIAGLVSHGFLRPWAVTFDFQAMEIRLDEE